MDRRIQILLRPLAVVAVVTLLTSALERSRFGEFLENSVTLPLLFQFRNHIQNNESLDPRLKVYAFDDHSFQSLGSPDLMFEDWVKVFENIADRKPKAILVDKYFGVFQNQKNLKSLKERLAAIQVPLIVGSFVTSSKNLDLGSYLTEIRSPQSSTRFNIKTPLDSEDALFVGPHKELKPFFRNIGHLNYDGHGFIKPLIRLKNGLYVPHATLLLSSVVSLDDQYLIADNQKVPLTYSSRLLVNLMAPSKYASSVNSLLPLLQRSRRNLESTAIQSEDVVLILPKMFTGNTDFIETPQGVIPGGYLIMALVHSHLSGNWLDYMKGHYLITVLACFVGLLIGMRRSHVFFIVGIGVVIPVIVLSAAMVFSVENIVVSWLFPSIALVTTGLLSHAERNRQMEKRARIAESSLEGRLPPKLMSDIRKHPEQFTFSPTDRRVTVMFVDLVNFASATNAMAPREIFVHLREMIQMISKHVHEHGGVVDNVIGDGVICFFGYNYHEELGASKHAEDAVRCAVEIQKSSVHKLIHPKAKGQPVLPVRIGINTTLVHFGDLGGTNSIRPTLVGAGVNLAARLESSCEPFRILLSEDTRKDLSDGFSQSLRLYPRFVGLKHFKGLHSAWEIIPLESDEIGLALERFQSFHSLERFEQRYSHRFPPSVEALVDGTHIKLVNISQRGIAFDTSRYFGKDVIVQLEMKSLEDGPWRDFLSDIPIKPLFLQIVWGMPHSDGAFSHGARFINLPQRFRRDLMQLLQQSPSQSSKKVS